MNPGVLTVNGGSSSIKFALFDAGSNLKRTLSGKIDGIGLARARFTVNGRDSNESFSQATTAPDHATAVETLMNWMQPRLQSIDLAAIGHRVVHGGPKYWEPEPISPEMLSALRELSAFDPEHLPGELLLVEAFQRRLPDSPQVACFDTAFHHSLPRLARLLPIPRQYEAKGVRRYGFHGLSCAYLIEELARIAGDRAARGRVILAHLGNGASLTAVKDGQSFDTSMGFTPTAGVPMGTRAGDLDPGLVWFLAKTEGLGAKEWNELVNSRSGLLGVSETSSDMRELLEREGEDVRAAEAIALFCYQVRKWIGALAAALGGLDTLVFSGGIGEHLFPVRERICAGLGFLGIELNERQNLENQSVISADSSNVVVRVIPTDEESMIARMVCRVLGFEMEDDNHEEHS